MFKFIQAIVMATSLLQPKEVLLVGDSMAEGLSPNLKNNDKNYHVTSLYKRGSTISYWNDNDNLNKTLSHKKWDIVLISLGTNDLLIKKFDDTKYYKFIEKLSKLDSKVYWILPPTMPFRNPPIEELIENPPQPINKIDCGSDFDRAKDGVHLTQKSYKKWGNCIIDSLPEN